jgi:uncharacterized protein
MATSELIEAVKKGDIDGARAVLARDPGAAMRRAHTEESALQEACYRQNAEMIALIAARVPEPDIFESIVLGNDERALELADQDGENVTTRSYDGWTPLHLAAFFGRADVTRELLKRKAKVNAPSTNYMANTALHAAIAGPGNMQVIRALLDGGADPNAPGASAYTPFHIAASRGNRELIDLLVEHGANPALKLDDGKSAGDVAREHGHPEIVDYLDTLAASPLQSRVTDMG